MSSNITTVPRTTSSSPASPINSGSPTSTFLSSAIPEFTNLSNFSGATNTSQTETTSSAASIVPTSMSPKNHAVSAATIAGSAVAGVIVTLLVIFEVLYLRRSRAKRSRRHYAQQSMFEEMAMRETVENIQPYILEPRTQASTTKSSSSLAVGHNPKSRQHPDPLVCRGSGSQDIEAQSDILPSQSQLAAQVASLQQQVLQLQMLNDPENYMQSDASTEPPPGYALESRTRHIASVDELHEA